jgi:hypothetical protein
MSNANAGQFATNAEILKAEKAEQERAKWEQDARDQRFEAEQPRSPHGSQPFPSVAAGSPEPPSRSVVSHVFERAARADNRQDLLDAIAELERRMSATEEWVKWHIAEAEQRIDKIHSQVAQKEEEAILFQRKLQLSLNETLADLRGRG